MEGLFNERLQVRTRHLEERVGALSKQLAAQKEDNARLHRSHVDATHKVQLLEEDLKGERERCHKLAVTLSSSRRHMKNKSSRFEEGEPINTFEPLKSSICLLCGQCTSMTQALHYAHGEALKTDRSYEMLPNYMGIMPARLNSKLMKSKKISKSNSNNGSIAHRDRQAITARGLSNLDNQSRCVNCCCDVEVLLTRRLHLYDLVQQDHSIDFCKKQDHLKEPPMHSFLGSNHEYHQSRSPKQPVDRCGEQPISNAHISKHPANAKPLEQDLCALSREGFYVRMEAAKSDQQQSCNFDSGADFARDSRDGGHDYHDSQSLQYVQALRAENEALRGALLSSKRVEIQELESELREIKQSALSSSTLVTKQSTHPSCERSTKADNCCNVDENGSEWPQLDPIKFLDCLHEVEDKILQKKITILGLECGDAALESRASALLPPDCIAHAIAPSDGVHMKAHLNEDLRHLLKALARDVVLLRQENQWFKQKCHGIPHVG